MNLVKCDRCSVEIEEEATIIDKSTGACLCHNCEYEEKCEALQKGKCEALQKDQPF